MSAVKTKKAIAYIRVSRVNGRSGDSFISPSEQRKSIERIAAEKGLAVVDWYEELDASGGDSSRPLRARAESGRHGLRQAGRLCRAAAAHRGWCDRPPPPVRPGLAGDGRARRRSGRSLDRPESSSGRVPVCEADGLRVAAGVGRRRLRDHRPRACLDDRERVLVAMGVDADHVVHLLCKHLDRSSDS